MNKNISKKTVLENGIVRYEGREGQSTEYVEFDPKRTNRIVYIAQKGANGLWFVFKSWPGKKGRIKTLTQGNDKQQMVDFAFQAANTGA